MNAKISFIGFGRMGAALAGGALKAKVVRSTQLTAYDPEPAAQRQAARLKVRRSKGLEEAIRSAGLVFLCVKPQAMATVLSVIGALPAAERKGKVFVSIAAGIPTRRIEEALGRGTPVIRVMPNTPALLGAGMSAVSRGRWATSHHASLTRTLLASVGDVVDAPERLMDAVTAISGSGPAYIFLLAESLIAAARSLGMPEAMAERSVRQTLFGAGLMLKNRAEAPEELRRQVTSPGGTTEAAIREFQKGQFEELVKTAVQEAAKRSKQLSSI